MEPLRPLIADSAVVSAVNTGMLKAKDFTTSRAGCMLNPIARKAMIRAYESRLDQVVTHPVFGYRCSWRSMIRVHARLGDVPAAVEFGRVAAAPVNTLRQQTHRCQEISVCF